MSDIATWCDICGRFHPRRSRMACEREARRDRRGSGGERKPIGFGGAAMVAFLAGFGAGSITEEAVVAAGVAGAVLGLYAVYRLAIRVRSGG